MDRTVKAYLDQLLDIFWLRPETALWRSLDCALMHKEKPRGKGADFGCGDGMLSYILAGGRVKDFDVFMNVSGLGAFRTGKDIYNAKAAVKPSVSSGHLRFSYQYGLDHKDGLIDKARQYGDFYKNHIVQDLNKPVPLADNELDWGFSNILYWLKDPQAVLRGWGRAIKKDGRLYLFVPNENFKEKAWLYYKAPHKGSLAYLNYFDRGYNALIHHCYSGKKWETIFKRSGYRVVSHKAYLSDPVMQIWNIGTRPVSNLLISMSSRLAPAARKAEKTAWTKFFSDFLAPVAAQDLARRRPESECAFHFYVLENKK